MMSGRLGHGWLNLLDGEVDSMYGMCRAYVHALAAKLALLEVDIGEI